MCEHICSCILTFKTNHFCPVSISPNMDSFILNLTLFKLLSHKTHEHFLKFNHFMDIVIMKRDKDVSQNDDPCV